MEKALFPETMAVVEAARSPKDKERPSDAITHSLDGFDDEGPVANAGNGQSMSYSRESLVSPFAIRIPATIDTPTAANDPPALRRTWRRKGEKAHQRRNGTIVAI